MTADELCYRVLQLSELPGVPPVVAVHLGQAVAKYHAAERERREREARRVARGVAAGFGMVVGAAVLLAGLAWILSRGPW